MRERKTSLGRFTLKKYIIFHFLFTLLVAQMLHCLSGFLSKVCKENGKNISLTNTNFWKQTRK